jgi:hypothetical protein
MGKMTIRPSLNQIIKGLQVRVIMRIIHYRIGILGAKVTCYAAGCKSFEPLNLPPVIL